MGAHWGHVDGAEETMENAFMGCCKIGARGLLAAALVAVGSTAAAVLPQETQRDEVLQAFYDLVDRDPFVQRPAALFLLERGERDALPFLIAAMRYDPFRNETLLRVLREMSGQDLGDYYLPWSEWVVREGVTPHPAFRRWKADLLARLDPRFGEFLDPAQPSTLDYLEIQWGGVPPEGIPSLDDPAVIAAAAADYLSADELVFGVALSPEGPATGAAVEARAYPLRVLDWHEMTNDVVAGIPVALSYCTLCGSAILFDRRAAGRTLTFATSGLLYRSNKLMFDRQTRTLWSNLTGAPVQGALVGSGAELRVLPVEVTTWSDWRARHPATTVLSLETGYQRDYSPGAAYGEYFASEDLMFPVGGQDDRLAPKAWVFGLRFDDAATAFELRALQEVGLLNTHVGERAVVLVVGAGRAVRAYERAELTFARAPGVAGESTLRADDGSDWRITDVGLQRVGGTGFRVRLPGHLAYWFGWYAFFPQTELWRGEGR
ncbi:MAG: DUF3179 domain-containing protein [Acidobacteriota bacterium]|jgi:hypothetical protein